MFVMDLFDRRILEVLSDGRPRDFHQLLEEAAFSHNTLRIHLGRLVDHGLVIREKASSKGRGRPKFTYSPALKPHPRLSRLVSDPFSQVVILSFRRLKHLCRFEKGGYRKRIKGRCTPQNCPQIKR
ncbi:MAG: hypothetical protein DRO43_05195 [Candidatus Hecatellales archaeon]|nr:MAG: hypothetical protein DRO43_05195 [Candidatus Hecatellales archaeon]